MKKNSYYSVKELWPYYLFYLIIFILTLNTPFFWDKDIILSKRAFWFIDNSFSLAVPIELDTAYIPVLSYVLAIFWKIFGAQLWVGHALMIPLGLGLVYQFYRFLQFLSPQKSFIRFTLILLLIDTTLLS
ncbi:MAG: hypothetical protein MI922_08380, partial [Bacteroidales bacterium]|nr:hypothetical protein [Bacteroidales bacterium]